ncbi:MAG: hypothetical protein LUJ25_05530, partial [Firmicutes bacterium]|nr:hypothetical protein [Bacillota bacterium]
MGFYSRWRIEQRWGATRALREVLPGAMRFASLFLYLKKYMSNFVDKSCMAGICFYTETIFFTKVVLFMYNTSVIVRSLIGPGHGRIRVLVACVDVTARLM